MYWSDVLGACPEHLSVLSWLVRSIQGKYLARSKINCKPNDTLKGGPKQLTTHIKKIFKVKTTEGITELARHEYYSKI